MKSITVFCASAPGNKLEYAENARRVGKYLAECGITIVYGGSRFGLMGALADGSLGAGGTVIGVLPLFMLPFESAHRNLSELIMVNTMHERKLKMHELSDGIITLPGGFGTLEELFEILTWAQLGLHRKPIGLLNQADYYAHLIHMIEHMMGEGMLRKENAARLLIDNKIEGLMEKMENFLAPTSPFKIDSEQT